MNDHKTNLDQDKDNIVDSHILEKAVNGDPEAQLEIGKAYYCLHYTESNRSNAFAWISRSANQGNLEAQFKLGDLYALGWGTKKCRTSAYEWYTKAAITGYKKALIRIHNLYQEDIRINCRGQLNADEEKWTDFFFKEDNNIRELNEYRLKNYKSVLSGAIDYFTNQSKKHKSSNQDDPDVQQYLGFLYQHGYGVKKYTSLAIDYYTKAAKQGQIVAQYNLGCLYQYNTKIKFNYREAFYWYSLAAEGGNVAAQSHLAYFYEKGLATDINYQKALYWYSKAATAGHSGSQVTLGKWYRKGQYVEQDFKQATKWYKLAANQGNQIAQNCLDLLYRNGKTVEETIPEYSTELSRKTRLCSKLRLDIDTLNDNIKTERMKKLAMNAFKGDGDAMYEIGLNYYSGTDFIQNKDIGFKWICNAANADHKVAQFKLTEMHKQGDTTEQDYHKTSIWTKKLTKKKDDAAQYNLGVLYYEGLGVRKDDLEASKWFILSSDQGNVAAMCQLGIMKYCGFSFDPNSQEAFDLYFKAAVGGSIDACYRLGEAFWNGNGVNLDKDRALKLYDYSARHGNTNAQYILGEIYEQGQYKDVDYAEAGRYYSMISRIDDSVLAFLLAIKFVDGRVGMKKCEKIYSLFKTAEREDFLRGYLFKTPLVYTNIVTNYYNLIDIFIEVSNCGIDSLEYNIGYAYEYGIYSNTMDEMFAKDYKQASQWYTASVKKGDARALYRLGLIQEKGKGTEKNLATALDYYRKAADNNSTDAKYRLACMYLTGYYIPQDIIKAYYLFSDSANMGHSKSIKVLMISDVIEELPIGNSQESLTAKATSIQESQIHFTEEDQIRMLENMAGQGLVAVQYQLAKLYQNKNNPAAIKWLTLAAQNGISDACYRLGVLYEEGTYNQQNYEMAMELYERASIGEHEDAIYRLAKMHQLGKGTPINYTKAYDLYLLASEMGHSLASKALDITGDIYESPMGTIQEITFNTTSQEYEQSLFMCEHVAEQGNLELQYKLGTVYEYRLKEPNYSKTLKWYHMAASKSHREATYRLGILYEKGLGVDQDYKKAIRLFEQAKSMNSSDAVFRLGRVYQYGYGVDVDSLKAVEYYTLAANLRNPQSQHALGELYEKGELTPLNILEALKWHTKAYTQGYDAAGSNLFNMYDDTPNEDIFNNKLHKIFRSIISTRLSENGNTLTAYYNYHNACSRLGYWYYQHGDFKHAWECFSKSIGNRERGPEVYDILKSEYINNKDKNEILDNLQTQKEIVDGLDGAVLFTLGMSYFEGMFEKSTEDEFKKNISESGTQKNGEAIDGAAVILKQDYSRALFFLEKAAKKGHCGAEYHLATMYHYGYGVESDFNKAQECYDKASTDSGEYALKVGTVYHSDGELQDFSKALEHYAKSQNSSTDLEIGILYLYGAGVKKDHKKAIEYFNKGNNPKFRPFFLALVYYNGPDDIQDYNRAFRLFQKVIEQNPEDRFKNIFARCKNDSDHNITEEKYSFTLEPESVFHSEAYYYLGTMYKNGHGTNQDELEAKRCFLKAAEYGNKKAKQ